MTDKNKCSIHYQEQKKEPGSQVTTNHISCSSSSKVLKDTCPLSILHYRICKRAQVWKHNPQRLFWPVAPCWTQECVNNSDETHLLNVVDQTLKKMVFGSFHWYEMVNKYMILPTIFLWLLRTKYQNKITNKKKKMYKDLDQL